jgi:hypothetical protein
LAGAVSSTLLKQHDPLAVWRLPKEQAVELLAQDSVIGQHITAFYAAIRAYYPAESSLEQALAIIRHGVAFLETARAWARHSAHEYGGSAAPRRRMSQSPNSTCTRLACGTIRSSIC